jgi:predicted secreted protein
MSAEGGVFGLGATLVIGSTTVTKLTSIGLPAGSADDLDITTHDNTDRVREFIKGLIDPGEMSLEGIFTYAAYTAANDLLYAEGTTTVTITLPTTPSVTNFACYGYLKSLEGSAPHDDKIDFSATVKISGKPTVTLLA